MRSRATVCSVVFLCLGAVAAGPPPAFAAVNPHNVSACASCHPVLPRCGVDTGRNVSFTTSADDPGLCAPCHARRAQFADQGLALPASLFERDTGKKAHRA